MPANDFAYLSAVELATAIRNRRLSPVEVTRGVLARVDRHNPALNALVTLDAEESRTSRCPSANRAAQFEARFPLVRDAAARLGQVGRLRLRQHLGIR